jgi:serine/threonine protein kinase
MPARPKYTIVQELGAGGMGRVYKGTLVGQAGFQRPIVVKRLRDGQDPAHVKLFVEEAARYAVLDHDNIGRIFDFERVSGEACIILEWIDGWSLVEFLERHRELRRLPDVDLSVFIVSRVCRALQYVFERAAIVHRDVSPSNIMMTREGTVKLIDFGIATRSGTKDSSLTGKPAYMAPEMVLDLRADSRSDLFSLGAVFFEMLTLERLFRGQTPAEILEQVLSGRVPSPREQNPAIPDGVMAILRKALQRDPAQRYSSAGEMGQACEHHLYDEGYGPTNLALKRYLSTLFPADAQPAEELLGLSADLIPVEEVRENPADLTPVAPIVRPGSSPVVAVTKPQPRPAVVRPTRRHR